MITLTTNWQGYYSVRLAWGTVTGASYYNLYYSTSSPVTESSSLVAKIWDFTDFVVMDLSPNTTYYFKLWAYQIQEDPEIPDLLLDFSNELSIATLVGAPGTEDLDELGDRIKFRMYLTKKVTVDEKPKVIHWTREFVQGDEWLDIHVNANIGNTNPQGIFWRGDGRVPHDYSYDPTASEISKKLIGTLKIGFPAPEPPEDPNEWRMVAGTGVPMAYLDEFEGILPIILSQVPLPTGVTMKSGGSTHPVELEEENIPPVLDKWNGATAYSKNTIVVHEDKSYRSLEDSNTGNDPSIEPTPPTYYWTEKELELWNVGVTYSENMSVVYTSSGQDYTYISLQNNNIGKVPSTEPEWWFEKEVEVWEEEEEYAQNISVLDDLRVTPEFNDPTILQKQYLISAIQSTLPEFDTEEFTRGDKSIKLGKNGTASINAAYEVKISNINFSGKKILTYVRIADVATLSKLANFYIDLTPDELNGSYNYDNYKRWNIITQLNEDWNEILLDADNPDSIQGTVSNDASIINMRVLIVTNNTSDIITSGDINFDYKKTYFSIVGENKGNKPVVDPPTLPIWWTLESEEASKTEEQEVSGIKIEIKWETKKPELKKVTLRVPLDNLVRTSFLNSLGQPDPAIPLALVPYPDITKGELCRPPFTPYPPIPQPRITLDGFDNVPFVGLPKFNFKGQFIEWTPYETKVMCRIIHPRLNESVDPLWLHPFSVMQIFPIPIIKELPTFPVDSDSLIKGVENQKKFIYPPHWNKLALIEDPKKIVLENKMDPAGDWKIIFTQSEEPDNPDNWEDWVDIIFEPPFEFECLAKLIHKTDPFMFSDKIQVVYPIL